MGVKTTFELSVTVSNVGTALASQVYVYAGFNAGEDRVWNLQESEVFTLSPGESNTVDLTLIAPKEKYTRLEVQIISDGYAVDQSYSKWFDTP